MPESPSTSSHTVLLVEDDVDVRASTTESLEEEGFLVIGAETVDEGLARLRQGVSPAVILLDLMMPVRTGWDFRREQLLDPTLRHIPVVVITASGIRAESIRKDMGDVELVAKPYSCQSLVQAISRALAARASSASSASK